MKILIELPTWLGDSAMVTPAIENLVSHFYDAEIILIGSKASTELLSYHPKVVRTYILKKNYLNFFKIRKIGKFDLFISFRSSLRSTILKFCISSQKKFQFNKSKFNSGHQVEKYNQFINTITKINNIPSKLIIYSSTEFRDSKRKLLGINPGASYGNAKRWYPKKFAQVAGILSSEYDVVILGGAGEKEISSDIETSLIQEGIDNYQNLTDKTTITQLVHQIKNLDLLITGDSGPMHLAAAFQVPTVSIFGPTRDTETSQWLNKKSKIVKKDLECQPCMKRSCPLIHHNCMKLVEASEVIEAVRLLN